MSSRPTPSRWAPLTVAAPVIVAVVLALGVGAAWTGAAPVAAQDPPVSTEVAPAGTDADQEVDAGVDDEADAQAVADADLRGVWVIVAALVAVAVGLLVMLIVYVRATQPARVAARRAEREARARARAAGGGERPRRARRRRVEETAADDVVHDDAPADVADPDDGVDDGADVVHDDEPGSDDEAAGPGDVDAEPAPVPGSGSGRAPVRAAVRNGPDEEVEPALGPAQSTGAPDDDPVPPPAPGRAPATVLSRDPGPGDSTVKVIGPAVGAEPPRGPAMPLSGPAVEGGGDAPIRILDGPPSERRPEPAERRRPSARRRRPEDGGPPPGSGAVLGAGTPQGGPGELEDRPVPRALVDSPPPERRTRRPKRVEAPAKRLGTPDAERVLVRPGQAPVRVPPSKGRGPEGGEEEPPPSRRSGDGDPPDGE